MNEDDFKNALHLNQSEWGGDERTMTYALEHEMAYGLDDDDSRRSVTSDARRKWPKSRNRVEIPYMMSRAFSINERAIIASGMAEFHSKTCIK